MHGATPATVSAATTSATSVPFATATANQVCLPPAPPPSSLLTPHSISRFISTVNIVSLLVSTLTFVFFSFLASYDSHVLYKTCMRTRAWSSPASHSICLARKWLCGCLSSAPPCVCLSFFNSCPFHWLLVFLSPPPLSHRFQLYLQTTWLVTSMLRRCRSLSINGTCCSCCETAQNQWKHRKRVGVAFLICPPGGQPQYGSQAPLWRTVHRFIATPHALRIWLKMLILRNAFF